MSGDQLIHALSDPAAYPHAPDRIETLQTHISLLFFAGDRVYKVKKPVNLGFLDFSTLDQRHHFCEEEVRLNRRLAPDIYLGVVDIARDQQGRIAISGRGETVEYAVEMVRLPAHRMLDQLLASNQAGEAEIDAIAQTMAEFHARCATGPGVDEHAAPEAVAKHLLGNIDELGSFAGSSDDSILSPPLWEHLHGWMTRRLETAGPLLHQRVAGRRIRDGHGDLHTGNICLLERAGRPHPVIYDCIEFNPAFRCCDVASDLAFLGMDLDMRQRRDLSARLVGQYVQAADDHQLHLLQPIYRCHFALVRAKVNAIRSREPGISPDQRRQVQLTAMRYVHLAIGYTLGPTLLVMSGLPGSGKSWLAARLASPLGAAVLRSDEIRKELAGLAPTDRPTGRARDQLYSQRMTDQTYARMLEQARSALLAGYPVVLDGTYPTPTRRAAAIAIAQSLDIPWAVVHATATAEVIRTRMAARAADAQEVSDADFMIYLKQRSLFQRPQEAERVVTAQAETAPEVVVGRVLERLVQP